MELKDDELKTYADLRSTVMKWAILRKMEKDKQDGSGPAIAEVATAAEEKDWHQREEEARKHLDAVWKEEERGLYMMGKATGRKGGGKGKSWGKGGGAYEKSYGGGTGYGGRGIWKGKGK